jgi:hypothetical protein
MLASDLVGSAGAVALAIPAVRDQYHRFRRARETARAPKSPAPKLRHILARAWERRRNAYDGLDSLSTAIGAVLILFSFILKMCDV